jgi:3'-phosphoadenosine 5'-phosphosulfate (PAPS) 3'-phosphatase
MSLIYHHQPVTVNMSLIYHHQLFTVNLSLIYHHQPVTFNLSLIYHHQPQHQCNQIHSHRSYVKITKNISQPNAQHQQNMPLIMCQICTKHIPKITKKCLNMYHNIIKTCVSTMYQNINDMQPTIFKWS